jgi:hypothetical protein
MSAVFASIGFQMKTTNKFQLPEVVVKALTKDTYSRGDSNISVTTLIDSPRVGILKRKHDDDIEIDVVDHLWSRFGTAMHNVFENATEEGDSLSEERLFIEYMGWKISGAIDLQTYVTPKSVIISDYKVTSAWSVMNDKVEWHNQLNAYAWLVRKSKGCKVEGLRIIAILRDWQRRKAGDGDYPISPIMIVNIPRWSDGEQDDYMHERVTLHQAAEFNYVSGGELPLCSDKERWTKPTTYAVKKSGRVRAIKVHDSIKTAEEQVEALGKDHHVETREGECVRCSGDWCRVSQWCDQYTGEIDADQRDG